MSYQSFQFLIFVVVVLTVYYCVGQQRQKYVLAAANLLFYAFSGIEYLPFIAVVCFFTYRTGKKIGLIYREADVQIKACTDPVRKKELRDHAKASAKRVLTRGIAVTVGLLAVCKYTGFVLENLNIAFAAVAVPRIPVFRMILPAGISFYSFMALSYILDVYWKRYPAEESLLTYAVYLSYFPHVMQGPIDRFHEFKEQIKDGTGFSYRNLTFGAQLMLWGLFKKLVIADRLGLFVDTVFAAPDSFTGFVTAVSVAVYSIQIYADFSGCIDIVTGVSEMLGIRLRKNFDHPYFSRTMGEFWRRWHISLQEWFKDYIYYPVSASSFVRKVKKHFKEKNRKRASELFTACFPIAVVWIITGLWHGAAWKYVVWGIFHAILLIGSKIFENYFSSAAGRLRIRTDCFPWRLWQMLRTFFLCCVGRIFFRADNIKSALALIDRIPHLKTSLGEILHPPVPYGVEPEDILISVFAVTVLLIVDILQERIHIREALSRRHIVLRWILIYGCLFAVLFFGVYGFRYSAGGFIYEQF